MKFGMKFFVGGAQLNGLGEFLKNLCDRAGSSKLDSNTAANG